ncbi:septum formation initiator family protein [Enterococcus hirae]|jgi:cell division protein DivIC|nr:septum formation initiator family protein [Enterococcaceae bacterium]MCI1919863.1 septum formation initiator family protein [Enterococcaceae bacterium]MDM8212669.1 septum formation initiator family protein [Enterococcus hirae]
MKKSEKNKVTPLNTKYSKEQWAKIQERQRALIFKRRRLAVLLSIMLIIVVVAAVGMGKDLYELYQLNQEKEQVVVENQKLKKQQATLSTDVKLLHDDEYILKLARSKYYLSRSGEQIYPLPDEKKTSESSQDAVQQTSSSQMSVTSSSAE